MNVVELTRDLVRLSSDSGKEGPVVDYLEALFARLGWKPVRSGRNLHVIVGEGERLLLLNSHTDTVPVGEGWTRPPLEGLVEDGRLYGRGANDAKGCLAAMIVGLKNARFAGRVCLAATCEEETSGQGLEVLLKDLPRPEAAVVGEPTGLQPAVAQKGLLLLHVTAKGRSAHAAWGGGVNAVEAAARDVMALQTMTFGRPHAALGVPSVAVTQIQGGTRHNVIPDRCTLTLDIRTTPAYAPAELVRMVQERVGGEVTVRSQRLEAVDTDPGHPVVRAALAANPGARPFGSPTVSDWVFLKGVPTVKVGPGDSRRSHTPDEYVGVEELERGAKFYEDMIGRYLA